MLVSIIIPVLNEEANIPAVLDSLLGFNNIEIIFCDGGSTDRTCANIASTMSMYPFVKLVQSERGRGIQMNAGAKLAGGKWLLFLHADTFIPDLSWKGFSDAIENNTRAIRSGAFSFKSSGSGFRYDLMAFLVNVRSRWFKLSYGDQAIFVQKDLFEKLGGFRDDHPFMEDVEMVKRLSKGTGFEILNYPVITSPRRHEADGFFRRILLNLWINTLYRLGVHPKKLMKYY
jgi:rSAM/selenodomain-associated transferase 2